jgi:uncharacterized protein (TIGR00730 family)
MLFLRTSDHEKKLRRMEKDQELHFSRTNGPIDDAIDQLIELAGPLCCSHLIREMILAALKAGRENAKEADLKMMNSALKELRFTSKVFAPYIDVRKVTVFGSARTKPGEPVYKLARLLGQKLVEAGYMVITGGGGGIMQAVNEGAGAEQSFAVNIRLPFEQRSNVVVEGNPRLIMYKYFFTRKVAFLKEASAIVLFPGGFGTLDEAMETLTLLQTGKHSPMPLIFVDEPGGTYWLKWLQFFEEEFMSQGYISPSDFYLFKRLDSVDEVVASVRHFYRRYHSIRYVEKQMVIRLTSGIDPDALEELKDEFQDILLPGGSVSVSGPLAAEADEPELAHLPRLLVDFNRIDFGRLQYFIETINRY